MAWTSGTASDYLDLLTRLKAFVTEQMLPADGVYAGIARLKDGREFVAAASVGSRPTFQGQGRRLEAHLLVDGDTSAMKTAHSAGDASHVWQPIPGVPEYGWPINLRLISFLRDDLKFDSAGRLVEQMHRDCARAREIIDRDGTNGSAERGARSGELRKRVHA